VVWFVSLFVGLVLGIVDVELEKGADLPSADALAGWLEADGNLLEAVAVEAPGADVVFVAEGSVREVLQRAYERPGPSRARISPGRTPFPHGAPGEDLRLLFLWPVARVSPREGSVVNLYPTTPWFRRERVSVDRIAGFRLEWPAFEHEVQRIADAVAVAGLAAARGGRRRAVFLILGPGARDGSRLALQRVVRGAGTPPPGSVALTPHAKGVRLVH
jgi:hypothetical protein